MNSSESHQKNIQAGGNVVGRDNIVYYNNQTPQITWYQRKFKCLADEIEKDQRYDQIIEDLKYYDTLLDGTKGLEEKLIDGGRNSDEIARAIRQKQKFAKKQEKYKYYDIIIKNKSNINTNIITV